MNLNDVHVRKATSDDFSDVMNVERLAFGEEDEARLVKDLLLLLLCISWLHWL